MDMKKIVALDLKKRGFKNIRNLKGIEITCRDLRGYLKVFRVKRIPASIKKGEINLHKAGYFAIPIKDPKPKIIYLYVKDVETKFWKNHKMQSSIKILATNLKKFRKFNPKSNTGLTMYQNNIKKGFV